MEEINLISIYKKMYRIRQFELKVRDAHQNGLISVPIYLSVGQESIASALSEFFPQGLPIFAQHRCHSYYMAFGGALPTLRDQLLSSEALWDQGAGGSASISDRSITMFGHSGFMGDQIPIAAGFAMMQKKVTLGVIGDASAEEDYVIATLGFIAKKKIPLLIVCEDNNLSILTQVHERRNWKFVDVAKSFGCEAYEITDHPRQIWARLSQWNQTSPLVLNIKTTRHLWHAGSGQDESPIHDTILEVESEIFKNVGEAALLEIKSNIDREMTRLWK